jgi:uncharacterized protein YbjT (DUF2867 family)
MSNSLSVLVTGATGKQGNPVARVLLEKGHRVRALTRKPDSAAAQELKRLGAELATGNFDDRATLERAARGVDAVFAMATPYEAGTDVEIRQGITLADAVKAAGVKHLVYSSVGSADRKTGIPHFDSKYKIEEHIKGLGVPYSIIGPVFFMDNLISPWWLPGLQQGKFVIALPRSRKLQQIAVTDIGEFAVLVLEHRQQFLGKRLDIASDDVSPAEVAEILSRVTGHKIESVEQPIEEVRGVSEDWAKMFEWFNRVGYSADIARLRRDYPQVGWHTFEQWAKAQDWSAPKAS